MNSSSRVFSSNKEKSIVSKVNNNSKMKLELAPQRIPDYQGFAQHEKQNRKKGCNAFLNMLKHIMGHERGEQEAAALVS